MVCYRIFGMILSADELEILTYLKSWNGEYVNTIEICRSAGNRQKFKENPGWANSLMARLVDMNLIEVNERGHYRVAPEPGPDAIVIGDDYFPASELPELVAPAPSPPPMHLPKSNVPKRKRWISSQSKPTLKKSGT